MNDPGVVVVQRLDWQQETLLLKVLISGEITFLIDVCVLLTRSCFYNQELFGVWVWIQGAPPAGLSPAAVV